MEILKFQYLMETILTMILQLNNMSIWYDCIQNEITYFDMGFQIKLFNFALLI